MTTKDIIKSAHAATNSLLGSFWMVIASIFFTCMGILVKLAEEKFAMHAYELVFWRVLVATIVLFLHIIITGKTLKTAHFSGHFWRSAAGTISLFMFFYAITALPLATAITLSYTSSIFLAIFSIVLLKQKPTPFTWLSLCLGMMGICLILQPSFLQGNTPAMLIGLGGGALAGYAYLQVRELSLMGEPSWRIVFYFSVIALVGAFIMSVYVGFTPMDWYMLPYLLGIGLSALLAQLAMTHAYKVGRKFLVAALTYLTVVLASIYGSVFLSESLGIFAIVGILLVVLSGIVGALSRG